VVERVFQGDQKRRGIIYHSVLALVLSFLKKMKYSIKVLILLGECRKFNVARGGILEDSMLKYYVELWSRYCK
jgi:hypothetical protein